MPINDTPLFFSLSLPLVLSLCSESGEVDLNLNLNHDRSLRRRPSAKPSGAFSVGVSEAESFSNDSDNHSKPEEICGGGGGAGDRKESGNGEKERELAKFVLQPSAPAHQRIKESPLSSNTIFKQVSLLHELTTRLCTGRPVEASTTDALNIGRMKYATADGGRWMKQWLAVGSRGRERERERKQGKREEKRSVINGHVN